LDKESSEDLQESTPQTLPSFKQKSSEELLISTSTFCPWLYRRGTYSLRVQFCTIVELKQKLNSVGFGQPYTHSSANPALSSSPYRRSIACSSSGAYIAAQQAKFSSSQPLPLKKQPAEAPKELAESGSFTSGSI